MIAPCSPIQTTLEGNEHIPSNLDNDYLDVENMTETEIDHCEFWVTANRIMCESG